MFESPRRNDLWCRLLTYWLDGDRLQGVQGVECEVKSSCIQVGGIGCGSYSSCGVDRSNGVELNGVENFESHFLRLTAK